MAMKRKKFSLPPEAKGIMDAQADPHGTAVAVGINGQLTVFPDRIVISRRGLMAFGTHGFRGDKEIETAR